MNNQSGVYTKNYTKAVPQFDVRHTLHELKHFLPSQTPLRDFIHHNSLHAFQGMKFYDAIFKASKIFNYQVTLELEDFRLLHKNGRIREEIMEKVIEGRNGAANLQQWKENMLHETYDTINVPRIGRLRGYWKSSYQFDLDNHVQPLLFRILCSYLDQGIALKAFPLHKDGFLASVKQLESNSFSSFFKTKKAKNLLLSGELSISSLLHIIVGDERYYEQYLYDQQFSHPGWSGIVSTVEDQPHSLLDGRKISLEDKILFELLLEIDAIEFYIGKNFTPLATKVMEPPVDLFENIIKTELQEVLTLWQDAFEWSYYDEVLAGLDKNNSRTKPHIKSPSFQALFCIDERECSLRRHIESIDPACETMGTPGFFGVEFYFQPENGKFYDKLCPAPVTPKYLIKETEVKAPRKHELLWYNF